MAEADTRKTILIVDDMAAILEHARQILKDEYKIIPCTSARMALDIMSKRLPDIVLTDINMPDIDGFELLKTIKSIPEYNSIPVILITTGLTAEIEAQGYELGADDFVIKPFGQVAMLKKIKNQLMMKEIK